MNTDPLTGKATYSKSGSRVTVSPKNTGDSEALFEESDSCRMSKAAAWLLGITFVVAVVGVVLGVVAIVLVINKDTSTCNCETLTQPSSNPLQGNPNPQQGDPTPKPSGSNGTPAPGNPTSVTLPQTNFESRLKTVEDNYNLLSGDLQTVKKTVMQLGNLDKNVTAIQQLSTQLDSKVQNLQVATNKTTPSSSSALAGVSSCSQRYELTGTPSSGVYYYNDNFRESLCDVSQPGVVWTLIESFSLENEENSFSGASRFNYPYPNPPMNPAAYRNFYIGTIVGDSTHFRATCNFFTDLSIESGDPSTAQDNTAIISLNDYDPVRSPGSYCAETEYISINGKSCRQCTSFWTQDQGRHLRYWPSYDNCTSQGIGSVNNANYWGFYTNHLPPNFACTQSPSSTTQFWMGRYTNRTCTSYLRRGYTKSGIYEVEDFNRNPYKVFCDFDSEVGAAWTLIEAFERDQGDGVDVNSPHRSFTKDRPLNENNPNLRSYRLSRNRMLSLRSSSSTWRATCGLQSANLRASLTYQDYARARFVSQNGDILTSADKLPGDGVLVLMDYIGYFGVSCSSCGATWQFDGGFDQHMHVRFSTSSIGGLPVSSSITDTADLFGYYKAQVTTHKCSNGYDATTQWWVGDFIS
eukprot:m.158287 g.158287  ORF g.158287 m.158287 type:complete len:636 (+) comp38728_c0_seq3:17-1924(+)